MIQRDEIDAVARELQVNPADIEKDYVFGWLLAQIYGGSALGPRLILKGGNALRKGYFPNTRFSTDLDFVAEQGIGIDELKIALLGVCDAASSATGVVFDNDRAMVQEKKRCAPDTQALEARLYFRDFYGRPGSVVLKAQLDVTEYERLALSPTTRPLIHPYSDAATCSAEIRCVALEEVLASKLKCLLQRRHVVDLFDYVHWIVFGPEKVDAGKVLDVFLRKTIYRSDPGAALGLLLRLPFQVLRDGWKRFVVCPIKAVVEFEPAVQAFFGHLRDLFAGYSDLGDGRGQGAFLPAELRNVILDAGSRLVLVKMNYKGSERLVEPYSIKYKRAAAARAREYFYGWNLSGSSSPPGIRTFVADEFVSATVTDIGFEPRFEVEVAKAGDASQAGRFSSGSRVPSFGIVRKSRTRSAGFIYRFRCTVCGRLFARQTWDSTLRPHKRPGGSQCFGSIGRYLGTRL